MRTFTRGQLDEARAAWDAGDFSPEWRGIRHKAVMGGLIYPPAGTKWDSWEDDSPSQRAILIRAIRETPELLERCVIGAPTWFVVIERLTRTRDDWREELDTRERDAKWRRSIDEPDRREAPRHILGILERIWESRP